LKILLLYAHPVASSYAAALRDCAALALREAGHEVDLCDLNAERFDAVLSAQERSLYRQFPDNASGVSEHVARLRAAEGVVLVFPTWWYGMPAILKGYFDRVWVPGVAFDFGPGAIRPLLGHIRLFGVVTTYGSPWWFMLLYMGNPSRKVLMRGLSRLLPASAKRFWLPLYGMESASAWKRERFLQRIRLTLSKVR
jgi:putative NADPH-quinone reductase